MVGCMQVKVKSLLDPYKPVRLQNKDYDVYLREKNTKGTYYAVELTPVKVRRWC